MAEEEVGRDVGRTGGIEEVEFCWERELLLG